MRMEDVIFDSQYYNAIMKEFGYSPLEFEYISFSLGLLTKEDLRRQWLRNSTPNRKTGNRNKRIWLIRRASHGDAFPNPQGNPSATSRYSRSNCLRRPRRIQRKKLTI